MHQSVNAQKTKPSKTRKSYHEMKAEANKRGNKPQRLDKRVWES